MAQTRHRVTDEDRNPAAAEWQVVTELLRRRATDADIAAFLRHYPVGGLMRSMSTNDIRWVAGMRRRWSDPVRRQRMVGRQESTTATLDRHWATMQSRRWTAFVGFLGLSAKAERACTLDGLTCSQREIEASTGTPGQTVWGHLQELPFVTMTTKGTVATGSTFTIAGGEQALEPVPGRPARAFMVQSARHPAVLGGVLTGRRLLVWATVAQGATTEAQIAAVWGITGRTAHAWVQATALIDAIVVAADGTLSPGCMLDELAVRHGVVDAPAAMAERHRDAREQQRASLAERAARRLPTERFDAPAALAEDEDDHAGWIASRFVEAVDAPNLRRRVAIRVGQGLIEELLTRCGGDLDVAIEAANVAGAAVTAWAWAREAVAPEKTYRKVGPVETVAREAIRRHLAGRPTADVIARAGRDGARVRRPLTLEQRQARAAADRARRLERTIAREQARVRAVRPLIAIWPRDWGNYSTYATFGLAMEVQRRIASSVDAVRQAGVVEDLALTNHVRRAIDDAVTIVTAERDPKADDVLEAATAAAITGLRALLPGVFVPGSIGTASDTGAVPVLLPVRRTERRAAA